MLVREMDINDLDEVWEIEHESFSKPWSKSSFIQSMSEVNNFYLVVVKDGKVVGYCGCWGILDEGHICNVAVKESVRRQGVGILMLKELISHAQARGIRSLTLEVRESNMPAINLYKKLGFTVAGMRKDFYTRPQENAIIMWRREMQ
jgi:ribosomal-protein-alanine N-acetyltransferase